MSRRVVSLAVSAVMLAGFGPRWAPAQARRESAADAYRLHTIDSRELGDRRHVWVRVPPNYALHRRALPLTIVLDGDDRRLLDLAAAATRYTAVLDAYDPDVPEQIVVGVESHERGRDFGADAEAFGRFLVREVVPVLARSYRVSGPHVLVGHSLAGAFALRAMCEAPSLVRGVVAISPALTDSGAVSHLAACLDSLARRAAPSDHAVFLAVGSRPRDGTEARFRPHVLALAHALDAAGGSHLQHALLDVPDVSHSRTPLAAMPPGLAFVLTQPDRALVDAFTARLLGGQLDPGVALDSATALRSRLGVGGPLPARWFHMTALLLAAGGHEADAARVAREALAVYPEQLALYEVLAEACAKQGDSTCARQAARRAIDVAARREDLAPFARARAIDALRARWLATPAPR